jgi:hypothetical protein
MTFGELAHAMEIDALGSMFKIPVDTGAMREIRQNNRDEAERLFKLFLKERDAIYVEVGLDKPTQAEYEVLRIQSELPRAQIERLEDEQRDKVEKYLVFKTRFSEFSETEVQSSNIKPLWTWDDIKIPTDGNMELGLKLLGLIRAKDAPAAELRNKKQKGAHGK